jgi:hypothetical protein
MTSDFAMSRTSLIRLVQAHIFLNEIALLRAGRGLLKGNRLVKLNSFVDVNSGILYVGSRLSHSELSFERRHPPILPRDSSYGRLLVRYKAYVALFVCFVTRALHLELISDLTTSAFTSAFRRFMSWCGLCRYLYNDYATSFKGADNKLQNMFKVASTFYNKVGAILANDGTSWTFIPPNTPHYDGLRESGIKLVKHHLKRALHIHTLTFEEFNTILVDIEVFLNSRPLSPLTSDPEDLNVLFFDR